MIACLTIPYFAAAVERRHGSELVDRSPAPDKVPAQKSSKSENGLVIGGQPWEPQPLYAFSWEAARRGVKPGMSLRLAHFLSPQAHFLPANPPLYISASGEITDILTDITHLVEPETFWAQTRNLPQSTRPAQEGKIQASWGTAFIRRLPVRYTLDLESLPHSEALSLIQEMGRIVRKHTHLAPAIGLAENKFVAQMAAALTRPNHARSVPSGEESQFLASQTIHFLPLDKETSRRLSLLGINTLGQLVSLPASALYTQLGLDGHSKANQPGKDFHQLYHLVKGEMDTSATWEWHGNPLLSVRPLAEEKQEQVNFQFDPPIANMQTLERVLAQAATELAGRLQTARLEGKIFQLVLEVDGGLVDNVYAKLTRRHFIANHKQILDSLRELLQQIRRQTTEKRKEQNAENNRGWNQLAFSALTVILTDLVPTTAVQRSLFDPPKATIHFNDMLPNIIARYGNESFFKPVPADINHPLLERRFQLQKMDHQPIGLV